MNVLLSTCNSSKHTQHVNSSAYDAGGGGVGVVFDWSLLTALVSAMGTVPAVPVGVVFKKGAVVEGSIKSER